MTRALIDPEFQEGLDNFRSFELNDETLPALRSLMNGAMRPIESYSRGDVIIERRTVPGPSGALDVAVLVYRPSRSQNPMPMLLHIHGGGYVLGLVEWSGPSNVRTAAEVVDLPPAYISVGALLAAPYKLVFGGGRLRGI